MRVFIAGAVLLFVADLESASVSGNCFAAQFPGPATCESCPDADIQGTGCVRHTETESRWMPCHKSVEECCKNERAVLNHHPSVGRCVSKSAALENASTDCSGSSTATRTATHPPSTKPSREAGIFETAGGHDHYSLSVSNRQAPNNNENLTMLVTTTESIATTQSTTTESKETTYRPSVCIAVRSPPFTCKQCPEEDIRYNTIMFGPYDHGWFVQWACVFHENIGHLEAGECHQSIEDCCNDVWIDIGGYGYNYCINKSGVPGDTTTSTPYTTTMTSDSADTSYATEVSSEPAICIAPLHHRAPTCEPCRRDDIRSGDLCLWWSIDHQQFGECFESIEECCQVFQFSGAEAVNDCISNSGPGDCIAPQFPPFTCERCPAKDIYFDYLCDDSYFVCGDGARELEWQCSRPSKPEWAQTYERCHRNVEDCCNDASIVDGGYGYNYCISKSGVPQDTTTTTPHTLSEVVPHSPEIFSTTQKGVEPAVCIAPYSGICMPCRLDGRHDDLCVWQVGEPSQPRGKDNFGECFKNVEECCEVFQYDGAGKVDECIESSSDCIAPQFPPLKCGRCPEEDLHSDRVCYTWGCGYQMRCGRQSAPSATNAQCYRSVDSCCRDSSITNDGYGYDYCIDKSNILEYTSTSAPPGTTDTAYVHVPTRTITTSTRTQVAATNDSSTVTTTTAYPSAAETSTFVTVSHPPSVCIASQFPPFTCEQCPEEDIEHHIMITSPYDFIPYVEWACKRNKNLISECRQSIEDCCNDVWPFAGGYGYDYCINRSGVSAGTTTSTAYTSDSAEASTEIGSGHSVCIAPFRYSGGTCEPCVRPGGDMEGGLCLWYSIHNYQYGECFDSVEECCQVFQFDGAEKVESCISNSGPGDCIAPRVPQSTCERCAEGDTYFDYLCDRETCGLELGDTLAWQCGPNSDPSTYHGQCYRSVESCCHDSLVHDDDYCVSNSHTSEVVLTSTPPGTVYIPSSADASGQTTRTSSPDVTTSTCVATPVTENTELTIPRVEHEYCATVASLTSADDNDHCMKLCDDLMTDGKEPTGDEGFKRSCAQEHWHESNGHAVIDGDCYEQWVYGYSEGQDLSSYVNDLVANTPAQCQLLCQKDTDCVNWLWVTDVYAASGADAIYRCSLKNEAMVGVPLQIVTECDHPGNMDVKYCNYLMPYQCMTSHYDCLKCGGKKRCVWKSDLHVSGWKYCGVTEACSLPDFYSALPTVATAARIPGEAATATL